MAHVSDLPCDGDGICMLCKQSTSEEEKLLCSTCATPWHVPCLSNPPPSLSSLPHWQCPDCSPPPDGEARSPAPGRPGPPSDLIAAVRAIEADGSLTEKEKARRRQELVSGSVAMDGCDEEEVAEKPKEKSRKSDVLELLDGSLICSFCMQLPERPVTTPCGHNFCLNCFQKWIAKGKRSCVKCRGPIPPKMASQPRINSTLVAAIRVAKTAKTVTSSADVPLKVYHFVRNQDRPDKAFTTERAQKAGKANACSGKIFVTVPPDHFGPILAENDPIRNQGVLVGESWEDRMECRQWGVHLPHVAGIAGQSEYGAQSVALSGGYQDDEDHGEWFLYTGSGGRDLSGNKRTNKEQSFDQKFEKMNQALRVSCRNGYPVRVVRSHKEKRSSYAPETGVRYDGTYRIEKCWRKVGIQGFKVCRYLFVRCDNEPAPWTSDENGDRPRPLPDIKELKDATDITLREGSPAWDYDEKHGWRWVKPPPPSRKPVGTGNPEDIKRARKVLRRAQNLSVREKLLKEFSCLLCHTVMNLPLTTPCAHNFCKPCLEGAFAGQTFVRERIHGGGRTLRAQKNVMKCPCCANDISDFLQNPQVNRELMDVIESLKRQTKEDAESSEDGIDIPEVKSGPTDGDNEVEYEMPANEDSQIAANNGRQLLTHEQKNSIMPSKEPKDGCSQNPEIRQPVSYNHKKTGDGKKGKASKKSNEVGSEKPEMIGGGSNGCQLTTKESTQPMTCSRERPKTSKKVEIGKKFNEAEPEYLTMAYVEDCQIHTTENEQPPLTSERKKARNGKKENTNKKSDKDDQDILEAIDGSDKDHNICQSKQPLTCMKEPRYLKNATESKKSNEPDVEYLQVHNGGDNDGSTAENEQPKIHVRERPITRSCSAKKMDGEKVVKSKESTDVKKPAERKISNKSGSENPEMLNGSGKGCLTTKAKQPKLFMRKRPLTRSCTKKVEGRNAKKSKKLSKVEEDGGGTSPSSPLHVLSDDDDDLE